MSDNPIAIDLFCGAGGLSEGLKEAGYEIIYSLDANEDCKINYDANHSDASKEGHSMTVGDITEIDPEDTELEPGDVDLVAGGPPCPTFSLVGRTKINSLEGRSTSEDDRHQLYEEFLKFVDYLKPDAFIMENVEGMMSETNAEGEPVVEVIKSQMEGERCVDELDLSLDYSVTVRVVDAANFGVPQRRKRVLFIGNRKEVDNPDLEEWMSHRPPASESEKMVKPKDNPKSIMGKEQKELMDYSEQKHLQIGEFVKNPTMRLPWNTVADAITDLPPVYPERTRSDASLPEAYRVAKNYRVAALSQYQDWVRDIPKNENQADVELKNHECRGHNLRDLSLYKMLGEGTGYKIGDLPDELQPYRDDIFNDNYKKQNPKKPSSTIVAHIAKDGHMFIHPTEARSLTPREVARLQSFKDSYIFETARTKTYTQIGNAVPPLLAKAVATAVKEDVLDK